MADVAPDGLVVVDKPAGWTSHDVVARTRKLAGTRKVGHAGTLDPMATGVLVLGVGRATRLLTYVVGADKTYVATIRLGVATVTDDAEGEVTAIADAGEVTAEQVLRAVADLTGPIQQVPSAVSAIKVDGRRSYARVRAGEQVELAARSVVVRRFDVLGQRPDVVRQDAGESGEAGEAGEAGEYSVLDLDVEVDVSSGTYVRALARDLGAALGVGGHLTALRRTVVGPYRIEQARTLDELDGDFSVLPLAAAARAAFAARELSEAGVRTVRFGQRLEPSGSAGPVAAFAPDGSLVALLEDRGDVARSLFVVPTD